MTLPPLQPKFFSSLVPEMATRAARATVSRLGFSNSVLRRYLAQLFGANPGEPGCFVGEPVFEATFGWQTAESSMESLSPSLLAPSLVNALDQPAGESGGNYRFPRQGSPYTHQLEAWKLLIQDEPQSVIVTSGTGSGKTECFMVPILNQLARAVTQNARPLEGVRALFLYPLNALIQSQQERLHAWTGPFEGDIRFCLYNGNTPNRPEPKHKAHALPNQVLDRESLRASPPPILVTNATMLEYMLVRSQDAPILGKSQGKLEWVVLDEAHSYIGSQAAELALLLRRVLHGFGVRSGDVRFVATSATIGDPHGEAGRKLRDFLAGLAGVSSDRVHVVSGQRAVPSLPSGDPLYADAGLEVLDSIAADEEEVRFQAACGNATARAIRKLFVPVEGGRPANQLKAIRNAIQQTSGVEVSAIDALRWLDLLTRTRHIDQDVRAFLPLRLHAFHNVLAGLWACCDPACRCRAGTALDDPEWTFGAIYTEQREACACGAPVFELRSCNDCNETYLWAKRSRRPRDSHDRLVQSVGDDGDDFQLDDETESTVSDAGEAEADGSPSIDTGTVLIANRHDVGTAELTVELKTHFVDNPEASNVLRLRGRDEDGGVMTCPECGGHHGDGRLMFRAARLGAPFLLMQLIPTLLEFCPDGEDPNAKPMRGRRMITFTDSRQGTARMAASLQQDAERNRVRTLVYQHVASCAGSSGSNENAKQQEIKNSIAALEALNTPSMAATIATLKQTLADLSVPSAIGFAQMADYLAQHEADINRWALGFYRDLDPGQFSGDQGAIELAKLFLVREFSRRPKRANSLETMGLIAVRYPKLENISVVPAACRTVLSLDEWKAFLKIALDFYVRESSYIDLKDSWRRWIGIKFNRKQLLPPGSSEKQTTTLKRWPQCNVVGTQGRLVRLLALTLMKDPTIPEGRDTIDMVLRAAWEDLVRIDLLRKSSEGRFLSLEDMAFALISDAWLCPVTRRILDTTLRGITTYLPHQSKKSSTIECQKTCIPVWPGISVDYNSAEERLSAARAWLAEDAQVTALRAQGVWTNLNDRIVEGIRYFRAAEHSAQQSGAKLSDYEGKFKSGLINLLSCSTTMEMGVDIGGISVVAMNNVPPHPANYLQRAGRAGRRSETRSVAVTVCKNNPHDQHVFLSPMWPFVTALPAPAIMLKSPVIVQRHFNAMLLAHFLWRHVDQGNDLNKLDMEWWSLPAGESRMDQFVAWTRCFSDTADPELTRGLQSLLKHTCFDNDIPLATLAEATADAMEGTLTEWYGELTANNSELAEFGSQKESNPAFKALMIQRKRLTAEYLLRELASGGFLPGYGFPTNITSFDLLNMEELDRQKQHKAHAGREDNKMRHRDLPSRDAVTALREYAPGAEVVIDGLVYQSAGITLNWHAPASEAHVKEIQSIRQSWRCTSCGASGTALSASGSEHCSACGAEIKASQRFTFLEPAGFAVDLYEPTHTDVSTQTFVPVEAPWINADGLWRPLPNPVLGNFRSSPTGRVFNHSSGVNGNGYAICLECGRAEPMPSGLDPDAPANVRHLPKRFRTPHRRLRGAQGGATSECKGSFNSYAIKPHLHLGLEVVTDVLELQLNTLAGLPLSDPVAAYSIAVVLRSAIGAALGVEIGEIGCDTKQIRHPVSGIGYAIVLYDRSAAGYCSSIEGRIPELLVAARKLLDCPAECQSACQHCLLTYDGRFRLPDLDRFAAMEYLKAEWLQHLSLQTDDAIFGEGTSFAEAMSLAEAIESEWSKPTATELRIYLKPSYSEWDIAISPLRRLVQRWSVKGKVILVLPQGYAGTLPTDIHFSLSLLGQLHNVGLHEEVASSGVLCAEVVSHEGVVLFGSRQVDVGVPNQNWGGIGSAILVRGTSPFPTNLGPKLSLPVTLPAELTAHAGRLEIRSELNGSAEALGTKLVERIAGVLSGALLDGDDDIKSVVYRDRYLNAPLPAMLLISVVDALKTALMSRWASPVVEVVTVAVPDETTTFQRPNLVYHNWRETTVRDKAMVAGFDYCGMTAVVRNVPKSIAAHARMLEVTTVEGHKLKIWLDQGFGYWVVPNLHGKQALAHLAQFGFAESPQLQGEALGSAKCHVEGQSFATQVFVEKTP